MDKGYSKLQERKVSENEQLLLHYRTQQSQILCQRGLAFQEFNYTGRE